MKDKLTLQELELLNTATAYNGEQHKAICGKAALELTEYKKVEEELGIDLITLINIFDKGFYALVKDDSHKKRYIFHFDARDIELCIDDKSLVVYEEWSEEIYGQYDFKHYGKTWALTKEELL